MAIYIYPPQAGVTVTSSSNGPNGSPIPLESTLVGGDSAGTLVPMSVDPSGNVNANVVSSVLPAGASTAANQASQLAQETSTASNTATIAANQTNGTQTTQITGSVPLPTGAATAANQTSDQATVGTPIPAKAILAGAKDGSGNIQPLKLDTTFALGGLSVVDLSTQGSGAGASGVVTVIGGTGNSGGGIVTNLTMDDANTGGAIVVPAGSVKANAPIYNVYSSTNISTSTYVQLVAAAAANINHIHIFDSSGQAMILAIGAPGSEVVQVYVQPGGDNFDLFIPAGSRIAYKALTGNATTGYLTMSFLE